MSIVQYSSQALADLEDIAGYIEAREGSIGPAKKWIDRLRQECQSIGEMPFSGRDRKEVRAGLRSRALGAYIVYYFVADHSAGILVARVLHGARDQLSTLEEDLGTNA